MHTIYDIALSMESLTPANRRKLFNHFGSSEKIYSEPLLKIQRFLGNRRTLHPEFVEEAKKINDFINLAQIKSELRINLPCLDIIVSMTFYPWSNP